MDSLPVERSHQNNINPVVCWLASEPDLFLIGWPNDKAGKIQVKQFDEEIIQMDRIF
jgi:hypothetical protein